LGRKSPGDDENGFPIPVEGFVGVSIHNGIAPVSDAVILDNVTVRGVGDRGVGVVIGHPTGPFSPGGRAIVRNSHVVDVGNGIQVNPRSVGTIHDNLIRSVRDPFPSAEFGISVTGATVQLLRNNISGFTEVPNFDFCDFCFSAGIVFQGTARIGGLAPGTGNDIHDNAAGLLMVSTHGVTVSNNAVHDNLATGITVDATSSLNRFLHNVATNNARALGLDCLDRSTGSGTANTWIGNIGAQSFPPAICLPPVS
jgi:parallel beta-helix repeat protein